MNGNKLTDNDRAKIYGEWLTGGYTLYQLSQRYNVSQATVSNIISKKLNNKKRK